MTDHNKTVQRFASRRMNVTGVLLILLLGLLVGRAWLAIDDDDAGSSVEIGAPAAGLDSISWTGALAPDGRLSVRVDYSFSDNTPHEMDIRLPDGARYLAVDGRPIAADIGKYTSVEVRRSASVTYELPDRVTRYRGGALVQLDGLYEAVNDGDDEDRIDGDEALFPCPRCYIDGIEYGDTPLIGALYAPGASGAQLWFGNLSAVTSGVARDNPAGPRTPATGGSSEASGDVITFVGNDSGTGEVFLLAVVPELAVSELNRGDGTVTRALESRLARLESAESPLREARRFSPGHRQDAGPAVLLTLLFGGFAVVLVVSRIWRAATRRIGRPAGSGTSEDSGAASHDGRSFRPSELEPALAGFLVDVGSDQRSVIAATILNLARRNVISITGTDRRRLTVTIPDGATGETDFERAVLTSLRANKSAQASPNEAASGETRLKGPALWPTQAGLVTTKVLHAHLLRSARRQKLIRANRLWLVAVPLTVAMGIIALREIEDVAGHAWLAIILGPVLALFAARRAGVSLTRSGQRQREEWAEYARWLESAEAATSDPAPLWRPDVTTVYAVALGAAPKLADALSPNRQGVDHRG